MPQYRSVEEISKSRDSLAHYYAHKSSWSVRSGLAERELGKLVGKDAAILDTGVGGGAFLAKLHEAGYRNLYGTDIENYLHDIKQEDIKGFSETEINSEKLSFEDDSMDIVTALAFLEHLENAFHFGRECARVLKPGGYLLVTMPNIDNLKSRWSFMKGGPLDGYASGNDHIMVLPKEVFGKVFYGDFELVKEIPGNAHIKIPILGKKIRNVPPKLFGNKVLYILKRK